MDSIASFHYGNWRAKGHVMWTLTTLVFETAGNQQLEVGVNCKMRVLTLSPHDAAILVTWIWEDVYAAL